MTFANNNWRSKYGRDSPSKMTRMTLGKQQPARGGKNRTGVVNARKETVARREIIAGAEEKARVVETLKGNHQLTRLSQMEVAGVITRKKEMMVEIAVSMTGGVVSQRMMEIVNSGTLKEKEGERKKGRV